MKYLALLILIIFLVSCAEVDDTNVVITEAGKTSEDTADESTADTGTSEEDTTETAEESEDGAQEGEEETEVDDETPINGSEEQETTENAPEEPAEFTGPQEIIIMSDITFSPSSLTVEKGTNILWVHNDKYNQDEGLVHIIRVYPMTPSSEFKSVQSTRMQFGDTFNVTLDYPGEYYYMDIVFKNSMKGYVTVTEPSIT